MGINIITAFCRFKTFSKLQFYSNAGNNPYASDYASLTNPSRKIDPRPSFGFADGLVDESSINPVVSPSINGNEDNESISMVVENQGKRQNCTMRVSRPFSQQ